jgi:hypothetical protein
MRNDRKMARAGVVKAAKVAMPVEEAELMEEVT